MTDPKIEGTLVLDGLIEGRLGGVEQAEDRLEDWVSLAREAGLPFSLEITGNRFSLLAGGTPIEVARLGPDPTARIADALRELLRVFTPDAGAGVFSTVRSTEYRPGQEVQTLYLVGPQGDVQEQQRTVEAETVAPRRPRTRREKVRLVLTGLAIAGVLVGLSALVVPYRDILFRLKGRMLPLSTKDLSVEAPAFEGLFTLGEERKLDRKRGALVLQATPAADLPRTDDEFTRAIEAARDSARRRLALEALLRGYLRCEYFDGEGAFLGASWVRVKALRMAAPRSRGATLYVPLPRDLPVRRIVLTY